MLNDVETGFEAAILVKPTLHAFQAHGRTLTYLAWGNPNRPPLVFLHGGLANAYWFAHIAPSFIDQFYVCALHLNGHGYSDWQDSYRLSDFSDSLDALLGQLNQAPPIIIGHSFGARIAFYFSHHYQHRIAYLCLLDPTDFTHSEVQLPRSLKQSRQISYYHDADVLINAFARCLNNLSLTPRFIILLPHMPSFKPRWLSLAGRSQFICKILNRTSVHDANKQLLWLATFLCHHVIYSMGSSQVIVQPKFWLPPGCFSIYSKLSVRQCIPRADA